MIGVRLGPWIIEEEIGRGGMGAVYRASRAADAPAGPAQAAIKVLAAELAVEPGFQKPPPQSPPCSHVVPPDRLCQALVRSSIMSMTGLLASLSHLALVMTRRVGDV